MLRQLIRSSQSGIAVARQNRCYGIMDSMRSGMKDAAEKKSEEMFMKQVKELSEKPTFLLRDFLAQNQEIAKMAGMRGFRSHLPWMKSQAEKDPNAKSTELQLKILEKLDDDELDHKVSSWTPGSAYPLTSTTTGGCRRAQKKAYSTSCRGFGGRCQRIA
mmetsp:Transcript_38783/g.99542  ORF Transcript_38783/g.99542 Transcript_38783/m.99542 type:complete len:160 (-) Transcript_38783:346-825(-)